MKKLEQYVVVNYLILTLHQLQSMHAYLIIPIYLQ